MRIASGSRYVKPGAIYVVAGSVLAATVGEAFKAVRRAKLPMPKASIKAVLTLKKTAMHADTALSEQQFFSLAQRTDVLLTLPMRNDMRPTTFECLLAHFAGTPMLPIETVAQYLGIDKDTLISQINQRKINLTYFRATDGQKGKKFVMVADLADHIENCRKKALEQMAKFSSSSATPEENNSTSE